MKLGIKIIYTDGGVQNGPTFNNDDILARYATDVRAFLRNVFPAREELRAQGIDPSESFDESSKIIYLLQFLGNNGYLATIVKARPQQTGRNFDNTAVWIHFPANIDISNIQTLDVLKELGDIISDPFNIDQRRLQEIADTEYGDLKSYSLPLTSSGETLGVIEYGPATSVSLQELLGPNLRQVEYDKYRGIMFIDKSLDIAVRPGALIPNFSPKEPVTIPAPGTVEGFDAFIGSVPFNRDLILAKGQSLPVVWKREDFNDIKKTLNSDKTHSDYLPTEKEMVYTFRREMFQVVDQENRVIRDTEISINKKNFLGASLALPYSEIKNGFDVKVYGNGYEPISRKCDFQIGKQYIIPIKRRSFHYNIELDAYDPDNKLLNEKIVARIDSDKKLGDNVLKGYTCAHLREGDQNVNHLKYRNGGILEKGIYFAIGAAVVGIIWLSVAIFGGKKEPAPQPQPAPAKVQTVLPDYDNSGNSDLDNSDLGNTDDPENLVNAGDPENIDFGETESIDDSGEIYSL